MTANEIGSASGKGGENKENFEKEYESIKNFGRLAGVKFSVYTAKQIRCKSALQVTVPAAYDGNGVPVPGGLLDLRFGATPTGDRCETCGGNFRNCFGHSGHLELNYPLINIAFLKILCSLINVFCRKCHRFICADKRICEGLEKCPHCGEQVEPIIFEKPYHFKVCEAGVLREFSKNSQIVAGKKYY